MEKEITPEQLHVWYLEAVSKLDVECYNAKANVPYVKLTEQQQYIDKYIADKIKLSMVKAVPEISEIENIIINYCSKPGFTEYTDCAKYLHQMFLERIGGING